MALGYCPKCDKLVPIKPGPQKWGSREREWIVQPHNKPNDGPLCDNKKNL